MVHLQYMADPDVQRGKNEGGGGGYEEGDLSFKAGCDLPGPTPQIYLWFYTCSSLYFFTQFFFIILL